MFFDEQFINEVKDRNDIIDVISQYTALKKSGNRYTGLCPFHSERTPSFSVSPDMQVYHCFGCGVGGTVIHFIEEMEKLDFVDTIKFLAERAGITLPEDKAEASEYSKQKKNILEMNKLAGRAFFRSLNSGAGKVALNYLRNRGLSDDTIKAYGLGYSQNSWDFIYKTMKNAGYNDTDIIKSGLCVEKNGKIFDFFRDRVMFPVMDIRGNVIAFGGRILGDGNPKYLNTGETPVFSKRNNLFSLNNAKNCQTDYIILAEGYMDVIALYNSGIKNAVASLGTAFSEEHARLLKRYTNKVIISFDSDTAGKTAARKANDILKKDGLNVRILKMMGAKDPDELIKKFGKEAYIDAIKTSMSGIDYELSLIYPQGGFSDEEERVNFVKNSVKILKDINNKLEQEIYIKKVSDMAKISSETALAMVKRERGSRKFDNEYLNHQVEYIKKKSPSQSLIKLVVENPSYFTRIRGKIEIDSFKEEIHKKIYKIFCEFTDTGQKPDIAMLLTKLDKEDAKTAAEIFIEKEPFLDFGIYLDSLLKKLSDSKVVFNEKDEKDGIMQILKHVKKLKEEKSP